ncbi:MAG: dihydroorotate dehydrogenase electron transfer subunit [Lachnospiraceae bacterium]|nr:dihydroorotate dehydrogenase electron transfer subunit [Lachnospiraceae bacterium]
MSRKKKVQAVVISQQVIAPAIYDLWLETELAGEAHAGQFLGIYPTDGAHLLPRPISICQVDRLKGAIRLVYRIAGAGTAEVAGWQPGQKVEVLGILGNGFPVEEYKGKKVLLLGGGIGIPPMLELARELKEQDSIPTIIVGYRDKNLFLHDDLQKNGKVLVATEDGSVGVKGNVLDALQQEKLCSEVMMACGPMPMLRAIKNYAVQNEIKAYISLEERMACGVGACLGCVCKTTKKDHHSHVNNARICTDGPVFDAQEVEI